MASGDVRQRLQDAFRRVFDDASIEIFDEMTAKDLKDWDSLNHINLIVAVEKDFGISLTTREAMTMANVGQFVALIERKLAAKAA